MERAPLRPIPARPTGPVSDPQAVRAVTAALPSIGARERLALALVALVGRDRAEVATRVGLDADGLATALAYARKELRRTVAPLAGSGWCERAERLISDRLDDPLGERDGRRLDVHLRNCPRCVEHERRLVQATDALVASVAPLPGPPAVKEAAPIEAPARERGEPAERGGPTDAERPGPAAAGETEAAEPAGARAAERTDAEAAEPAAAEAAEPATAKAAAPVDEPAAAETAEPADTKAAEAAAGAAAAADAAEPAEPARALAPAPPPEPAVPPPPPAARPPTPRPLRELGVVVTWHVLLALAVLLAVASLALAMAGLLGADL